MTPAVPKPLRLLAESAEDFRILSGLLQDSLLLPLELRWQKKLKRFSMPMSRFCWEIAVREQDPRYFRVASNLLIEGVVRAHHKGFDKLLQRQESSPSKDSCLFVNLLAVELAKGPCLRFTFSQGLELCLHGEQGEQGAQASETLRARLTDTRKVQRTDKLPSHRI